MAQENPIYKFLKENNLTTKSEVDFVKEYSSNPEKQKELYSFMKDNQLTTKDELSFIGEYFPKQKEVPQKGSEPTSPTLEEPTQNIDQQGQPVQEQNGGLLNQSLGTDIIGQLRGSSGQMLVSETSEPKGTIVNLSPRTSDGGNVDNTFKSNSSQEVFIPEGSQIILGSYNEYGLPAYAKVNEEGWTEGVNILPEVEIKLRPEDVKKQKEKRIKSEIDAFNKQGWSGKMADRSQKVYNSLLDGIAGAGSGLVDLTAQLSNAAGLTGEDFDTYMDRFRKYNSGAVSKSLKDFMGADVSEGAEQAMSDEFLTESISGAVGTLPAMIPMVGPAVLALQSYNGAVESIQNADVDKKLSPLAKTVYGMTVGAVVYKLEKFGLDKITGVGESKILAKVLANKAIEGLVKSGTKKIGGEALDQAVDRTTRLFLNSATRYGIKTAENMLAEGFTGGLQEVATVGSEYLTNALSDEKIFNTEDMSTWDGFSKNFKRIGEAASMEAVGGGLLGSISYATNKGGRDKILNDVKSVMSIDKELSGNSNLSDIEKMNLLSIREGLTQSIESETKTTYDDFKNKFTKEAQGKIKELNGEILNIEDLLTSGNVSKDTKDTLEQTKVAKESELEEIVSNPNSLVPTTVEPDLSKKTPEEIDANVERQREATPDLVNAPMGEIEVGDEVFTTLDKLDTSERVESTEIESAIESLYEKKKELKSILRSPERLHTTSEINEAIAGVDADLESLSNYKGPKITEADFSIVKPGDSFSEGKVKSSIVLDDGSIEITTTDNVTLNSKDYAKQTEIQSKSTQEDNVVPMESSSKQEAVATQEVVEPNVEINETAVETVTPEVGVQNQNVAIEPEQVTQVETNPEANEVQENTVQENEQTEVRAEAEQESPASTEMPDVDQTNPRLKSVLKSIPNQDVESLVGPANVEKRRDIIEAITGKRPAKNDAGINATRKAVDDYFGLTGDNASKASKLRNWTNFEQTEFSNEEEAGIYQIRNTEDPNEILDIYDTDVDNLDYKESAIADYVSKINIRDYGRYGDLNNLQGNRSLQRWIDSKNTQTVGLDVMAEELSDQIGIEVTPQDFIDFIESYSSAKDFREANKSNVKIEAENRYKELTGRNITENALERRRAARASESANSRREAVNRENMAAIGVTDTEVADRQNMESEQEKVAKQREKQASDKTPVSLLDGISQRLKQTGLAKSVKLMSSEDIESDLSGRNGVQFQANNDSSNNLVVLHNISANNLLKSLKAGGLPAPSLAVTSKENSFDSYGDITLITTKETIDPKSNKKNKIYSADAYTPRYPNVSYITKNGAVSKALSSYYNSLPNELSSSVSYAIENDIESKGLQGLLESRDAMLLYANSVNPDVVVRKYDDKKYPKDTVDYISSLNVYDYLDTADIPGARQKIADFYVKDRVNQGREESYVRERFIDEKGELNFNLAKQFFNEIKSAIKQSGKPDYFGSKNNAFDYISENNLQSDFESAMKDVYEKISPEEKIFKGFSPSGNRMYTANTPENALKLMKKEGFVGTENFFSGGPASARARLAPVFKSISDVKSKRDRVVSNEDFKSISDEINEKYWSVSNDIIEKYANDRSVDSSSFSYDILDLVKNGKSYNFNQLSKEDVLRVKDLADTLANAPTEYFEAKPERVVGMNEFAHAVIPKNTPLDVRRALEQNGIPYTEYTDSKNRGEVVRYVSDSNGLSFQKGSGINGYVDKDGNIVINRDTAGLDTPIHEFGHIWVDKMKNENPELYQQGIDLIKSAEGDDYVLHVMETQPGLTGEAIYEEALVQAIGDSGARLIKTQERSKITEWLKAAWDYIGGLVGISGKTPEQIANMTLREYTDGVAIDLLSGKPIQTSPSGDIFVKMDNVPIEGKKVAPAPITKASDMNVDQKKIAAFMEKMRLRNTVKYQGTVDPSSLSDSDLVEFIDVAQSLMNLGQVQSYSDLKDFASSLGIKNESQIKFVWNSVHRNKVLGIKKSLVDAKTILETKYDKLSDDEYREMGKQMVDEGIIIPTELMSDVLTTGRVLEPYEVTALIYGRTLDEKRIDELRILIKSLKDNALSDARVELEALFEKIRDYEKLILNTATAQSAAFRLRSLLTDKEYSVVEYIADMEAMGEISPDVRAELEALGREMESVKSELRNKVAELEALKKKQSQTNINKAAKKKTPPAPKPKTEAKKNEYIKDALDVLSNLNINDYGLPGVSFQMNGNVKFSINSSNPLMSAIQEALDGIQKSVQSKNLRLDDAIEEGIKLINQKVGKGNWNEMKFRSDILNQYVDKGHVVQAKRPYVGKDGKLVVPTAYLKEIVADYQSNNSGEMSIEDMVDAVMDEVGPGFNRRESLEAISRFGIVSANTRSQEMANIQRARTIGSLLAELEDLEKGIPRRLKKKAGPKNTRAEELRKQIHDIEEAMRMTPEERAQMRQDKALEAKKRYMKEYIDKIDNKIVNKDFEPEVKTPLYDFSNHPDVIELEKKREDIKNKFKSAKFKHELENRSMGAKALDLLLSIGLNLSRGIVAGTDISSFAVQGGLVTFSDPKYSLKALKDSLGTAMKESSYDDYFAELQRDPFFEHARKAKLPMQLPSFYQSVVEEQIPGGVNPITRAYNFIIDKAIKDKESARKWKDRFPTTVADRQYAVYLSTVRFDMFKTIVKDAINYQGLNPSTKEGEAMMSEIADAIGNMTMAANITTLDGATKVKQILDNLFFSLRKLGATFKIMYSTPYYLTVSNVNTFARILGNNSLANKTMFDAFLFDKVYSRVTTAIEAMATLVLVPTILANLSYDEDEDEEPPLLYNPHVLNPIHSDFMKLKIGNTRYSPFLGMEGIVVLASRLASREYMTTSSSKPMKIGDRNSKTDMGLIGEFFQNKLAPVPSIAASYLGDSRDKRESADRLGAQSFVPMWMYSVYENYAENKFSASTTAAMGVMGFMGASLNTYGGAEFASAKGTNNKEAYSIMNKVGLSDYTPTFRDKDAGMYDNGSYIAELDDKKFKKDYVPAYNEFMTKSTIVNGSKLLGDKLSIDSKDGLLLQMKKEAYNYAELKSTGVIVDSYFNTFNHTDDEGVSTKYKITRAQYPEKVSMIKNILAGKDDDYLIDSYVKQDIRDEVITKMDKDGLKRDKDYINMQVEIQLFRLANRYANEKLAENFKPGKYIPSQSYDPDIHEDEKFRD